MRSSRYRLTPFSFSPFSFRTRLVLLVVLMVALFICAVVWTGWQNYRQDREQLGRFHVQLARAISTAADRELNAAATVLKTLAASPLLSAARLGEFHVLARAVMESHPGASVSVFSASGERILDTRVPFGRPLPSVALSEATRFTQHGLPASSAEGLKRAIATGRLSVSDLFLNLVTGEPAVALHLPLGQEKGGYVLSLTITPAVFVELLAAQQLPETAGANLSDGRGLTIARTSATKFIGEPVSGDLHSAMARAPEGFAEGRTREGREVLFAHSRSEFSGWTAAVGVSRPVAYSSVWAAVTQLVSAAGAVLVVGILVAAWIARSVARPLDHLRAGAEALKRGEPVRLPAMPGEFSGLTDALSSADRAIQDREHERDLRAQADARREQAEQASQAKDRFIAMLSHELRNPLVAIANCTALLKAGVQDSRKVLDVLSRQTAQLRVLVEDVLDLARITHGKLRVRVKPVDLSEIARAAAAAYWSDGGRSAVNAPRSVWVTADAHRMMQIAGNLIENAVRYGGDRIIVEARAVADRGELIVEDNGAGIPAEILPRLFTAFVQGEDTGVRPGLGLGLALVDKLAKAQGGEVAVGPGAGGKGTRFLVRLPLTEARPAKARGQNKGEIPRRRVLIVEDEDDLRHTTCSVLEMEGHHVASAGDGADALRKVCEFRPEVAFVDLHMGDMSGYDFARKARALPEGRAVILVALSGYGQPEEQKEARDAGFDLHLTKPAPLEALRYALGYEPNTMPSLD